MGPVFLLPSFFHPGCKLFPKIFHILKAGRWSLMLFVVANAKKIWSPLCQIDLPGSFAFHSIVSVFPGIEVFPFSFRFAFAGAISFAVLSFSFAFLALAFAFLSLAFAFLAILAFAAFACAFGAFL